MLIAVVPVERLTRRGECFACAPLSARVTAGVCIDRQKARHSAYWNAAIRARESTPRFDACRGCALGARVADALGVNVPAPRESASSRFSSERMAEALRATGGHVLTAAKRLGCSDALIHYRLKRDVDLRVALLEARKAGAPCSA